MFNKVILVGNLTRDCELRYLPSGSAVCTTGIATNRKFKAKDGTQKEEVCFIDLTFFGRTAEIANQYLGRGKKVLVEGRLKLDQWTDQNGGKRSKHSITVDNLQILGSKNDSESNNAQTNQTPQHGGYEQPQQPPTQTYQANPQGYQQPQAHKPVGNEIPDVDINEEEIPF